MYYHEELAFTITINKGKCAGKATGDAGSIPACESKKTKRGSEMRSNIYYNKREGKTGIPHCLHKTRRIEYGARSGQIKDRSSSVTSRSKE